MEKFPKGLWNRVIPSNNKEESFVIGKDGSFTVIKTKILSDSVNRSGEKQKVPRLLKQKFVYDRLKDFFKELDWDYDKRTGAEQVDDDPIF